MRVDQTSRQGVAVVVALAIHVAAIAGLALSITIPPDPEAVEPQFQVVTIAAKPPPPPDVEELGPRDDVPMMSARFRPREPLGVTPEARKKFGDPGLAVWSYLCNRDTQLGEAARRDCPQGDFGTANGGVRDPLNRQGDAGVMFGAETSTMTLQEAGVKRGWMKKQPAQGQSALATKTDQANIPGQDRLYKDNPWLKPDGETVPDPH